MSSTRYHPKRRLRNEIFPLVSVFSLVLAIYFAFPSGSVDFEPTVMKSDSTREHCFITLDHEREAKLLAAARASWQTDSSSRRGQRADLLRCDLPERDFNVSSGLLPPASGEVDQVVEYNVDFVPGGLGAEAPASLEPEVVVEPVPAFSKDELLKLN